MSVFSSLNFLAVMPESLILILGILVLVIDPFWKENSRRVNLGWMTAGGLFAILALTALFDQPGDPISAWGGMVYFDWLAFSLKMFILFAGAITAIFMMDIENLGKRAEAFLLLLASLIGMCLMASSGDLIMLYLAIETTSIPLYVLAGFMLSDRFSVESGFKYLLFGAMTSAILLYGFSLFFGFTGTTNFYQLMSQISEMTPLVLGLMMFIIIGLAFKISAVPFHFWAPDVYQGSPTPVAGFLSTASKAAGFVVLLRLFVIAFSEISVDWTFILAIVATLTMTLGNFLAIAQKNIKRMLAYSSIAHAGYILIGVVAFSELGGISTVYYIIAYVMTNLAAFGAVTAYGRVTGSDEIKSYSGLSRRSPALALVMLVAFLSLAGMPPFGGFVAKVFVFNSAIQSQWIWLAIVGVLNSIIGLYYYLIVLKHVYLYRAENEEDEKKPLPISRPYTLALVILTIGIVVMGVFLSPWYDLATKAALSIF